MGRAFLVVMDSVGIGGAPDAHAYFNGTVPDTGANTLGHIIAACAAGQADVGRGGPLAIPTLTQMGMLDVMALANSGAPRPTLLVPRPRCHRAKTRPRATGNWPASRCRGIGIIFQTPTLPFRRMWSMRFEIAGHGRYFGQLPCVGHSDIILRHGAAHIESGWPICYTSADSVFQIAAHQDHFGLDRLLELCATVAPVLHEMRVGRVIARPFVGEVGGFERTTHRKDFAITPPTPILSNWVQDAGRSVYGVGKVGDIFSMQGFDEVRKGTDEDLMGHLTDLVR